MKAKNERKILQVALDVLELERAVEIGKECVAGGADWLEAGTPLIKSEGMHAIRTLRRAFPDVVGIVADMKIMDTGAIEVEMAAKSGASVVSILAAADNATIEDAIRSARKYGVAIMVDIMNAADPVGRAKELDTLGVDYVCVHVGIDQQMKGMETLSLLREVSAAVTTPLAVAGGIDAEIAAEAVDLGAEVVIVGGNIIRTAKVKESTEKIREGMDSGLTGKVARKRLKKTLDEEIFALFMHVSTPNISDAMHRKGVMRGINPLFENIKLVGKAVTVQTFEGDWAKPVEATDVAKAGDVIVVYASSKDVAPWGELASWSCKQKGIAGFVIDGAVRDVDEIRRIRFPVFAKCIVPNAGEPKGFGEINTEITCGGEAVKPGDWIIGDDNGVVVVPKARAYEIARRAKEVWKNEERVRAEIKRGKTLSQVMDLYMWEKK